LLCQFLARLLCQFHRANVDERVCMVRGLREARRMSRIAEARTSSRWSPDNEKPAMVNHSLRTMATSSRTVVPVPLHPTRLLARRFNQSAEIARPLARSAQLDYLPDALLRTTRTQSQGGRSARGRRLNVRSAFTLTEAGARRVRGRRVLLIDDVLTTGATAEACAKALLEGGARAVDLAVIARVRTAREVPK
jgi:ComF family protein